MKNCVIDELWSESDEMAVSLDEAKKTFLDTLLYLASETKFCIFAP